MRYAAARTLAALALGIACGVLVRGCWWIAALVITAGVVGAFFTRGLTLYLAVAGAGAILAAGQSSCGLSKTRAAFDNQCFRGTVVEEPFGFRQNRAVVRIEGDAGGFVVLHLRGPQLNVHYGDVVEVWAKVRPFEFPRNPGMIDYNQVLERRGFVGEARTRTKSVQIVGRGGGNPLLRLLVVPARRYVYRAADELLSGTAGALMVALLLGDRSGLPRWLQAAFVEGGVAHVLVVSGLHVGVVVAGVWLLLAVLGLRGWLRFGLALVATGFYVIMTGAAAASVRAGLMFCAALLSVPVQRRFSPFAALCSAGIVLLLLDPSALRDIGAQLSFAATSAIVLLAALFKRTGWLMAAVPPVRRLVLVPLVVSTAATIGTAPLLLLHYGRMQPLAPLSSLLVVPIVSLSILTSTLVIAVNLLWPWLAGIMAQPLGLLLDVLVRLAVWIGQSSVVMLETGRIGWPVVFWMYSLGLLAVDWHRPWARRAFVSCLGAGLAVIVWGVVLSKPETRITFLDPVRGDAVLLEDTLGRRLLVDAGVDGTNVLRDFLRARGIHRLDAVVVTHPDRDHYGGLLDVGRNVRVERLLVPTRRGEDTTYEFLIRRLEAGGTEVVTAGAGTRLEGFGFDIKFTAPDRSARRLYERGLLSTNLTSLVMEVGYGGRTLLLAGDMDSPGRLARIGRVWLVKSPHHGSRKGNPPELYKLLQPEYVVTMGRFPTKARLEEWLTGLGAIDINTRRDGGLVLTFGRSGQVFSSRR